MSVILILAEIKNSHVAAYIKQTNQGRESIKQKNIVDALIEVDAKLTQILADELSMIPIKVQDIRQKIECHCVEEMNTFLTNEGLSHQTKTSDEVPHEDMARYWENYENEGDLTELPTELPWFSENSSYRSAAAEFEQLIMQKFKL